MLGLWFTSYILLWIIVLIVIITLASIIRNLGVIYEALPRASDLLPPVTKLTHGEALPELTLSTLAGKRVPLSAYRGQRMAISVVSHNCPACHRFLDEVGRNNSDPDPLDVAVRRRLIVALGSASEAANLVRTGGIDQDITVLADPDGEAGQKWGVAAVPTTIVVDQDLHVVRQLATASAR